MEILFTGASSFTGYWFVKALTEAGHRVVAPLRGHTRDYTNGARAVRVQALTDITEIIDDCPFGSPQFLDLCTRKFDMLCHHAARLTDYRSPYFDIAQAVAENTMNLRQALSMLGPLKAVILSGSVFEANEAAGNPPLVPFSPYGVSKGLTSQIVDFYCAEAGVPFYKFVIPNPFGPLEEPRFCNYLISQWKNGAPATVQTPAYLRDNIHVDLLARAYAHYADAITHDRAPAKLYPSGYVEPQGIFAARVAREIRARSTLACRLEMADQQDFAEPLMRFNTDPATRYAPHWNEAAAWDAMIESYQLA